MTKNQKIGARIQLAREIRGWTKVRLADELGTTEATVSRWEAGKLGIGPKRWPVIADKLGKTVEWFKSDADPAIEARLKAVEAAIKSKPEPAPALIPINKAEIEELRTQVQILTEKLQEKERLIGDHRELLEEIQSSEAKRLAVYEAARIKAVKGKKKGKPD